MSLSVMVSCCHTSVLTYFNNSNSDWVFQCNWVWKNRKPKKESKFLAREPSFPRKDYLARCKIRKRGKAEEGFAIYINYEFLPPCLWLFMLIHFSIRYWEILKQNPTNVLLSNHISIVYSIYLCYIYHLSTFYPLFILSSLTYNTSSICYLSTTYHLSFRHPLSIVYFYISLSIYLLSSINLLSSFYHILYFYHISSICLLAVNSVICLYMYINPPSIFYLLCISHIYTSHLPI